MKPLRIALIGTGRIADRSLAPAIRASTGAMLHSVLSRDAERARAFAARHGAFASEPAYDDLDALLADPQLDAVLIATPDRLHAEHGVRAAEAGKHVLCEKPLVTSLDDGRRLLDACHRNDVRLGVAYHLRWHAGHRELVRRVRDDALGELLHARAQWTWCAPDASNWRASSDVGRWWGLAGVGTHALDMVRWIMTPACGEVVDVSSLVTRERWKGPHDETAIVALRFESGATAEVVTSVLFDSEPRLEVHGAAGSAVAAGTFGPHGRGQVAIDGTDLVFAPADPYAGEIEDFAAAVRDGRDPEVTGEEGLRNVEILLEACPLVD